ncbi:MAG: aldehyde dehydrogenase family protein [Acidobacteria bacterium]|nr:aldehyde dehydrogenase family protein [Acidobacteriota bacterium]
MYARAAARGKRVQCQGGAKNHVLVLPDADFDGAAQIISDSAFGCAGQRCLAVSVAVTVGEAHKPIRERMEASASSLKVGYGLDENIQMGPVITRQSKARVEALIDQGAREGATVLVDGRIARIPNFENGNFIKPTILENVPAASALSNTEIFGPVLSLIRARTIDEALEMLARNPYGNAASVFTTSGAAARKFRYEASAGNIGVNVGVAAPMAFFPFSGWKDSFFGVLHGQGRDAVEFYTEKKVVIERWPKE